MLQLVDQPGGTLSKHAIPYALQGQQVHQLGSSLSANPQRLKLSAPRKPPGSMISHERDSKSRKKDTSRLKTEVDWNEDLRPTDDEDQANTEQLSESDAGSSFIPSQDLVHESTLQSAQNQKRGGPITLAGPANRKSRGKGTNTARNAPKIRKLPLTALTAASKIKSRAKIIGSDRNFIPAVSYTQDIIELSNASSTSSSLSSPSYNINKPPSGSQGIFSVHQNGRGKSVGQKLAYALREVDLPTKSRSSARGAVFSQPKAAKTADDKTASPPSRMSLTQSSVELVESLGHGPDERAFVSNNVSPEPGIPQLTPLTKFSPVEPTHESQSGLQPNEKHVEHCSISQTSMADTNECLPLITNEHWIGATRTPESQRPLLTKQTPLCETSTKQPVVVSAGPKSSRVDQNGSPRLKNETIAGLKAQMLSNDQQALTDMEIDGHPATSNFYYLSECSDSDCSNCSSDEGPVLRSILPCSKFMRTMHLEYGLDPVEAPGQRECGPWKSEISNIGERGRLQPMQSSFCPLPDDAVAPNQEPVALEAPQSQDTDNQQKDVPKTTQQDLTKDNIAQEPSTERIQSAMSNQSTDLDPVAWIMELQAAQSYAQNLLFETNQVRFP